MSSTDEQQPRRRGRPKGATSKTGRYLAYSDADRDLARARLRTAQDSFKRAEAAYRRATAERQRAAADANAKGITDAAIAEVYGIPAANVQRMRARTREGTRAKARQVAKAKREQA